MTEVQVLDARRDAAGGYRVDASRGERIGRVSSEWFSRPADERYLSLSELYGAVRGRSDRSRTRTVESAAIRVEASREAPDRLTLALPGAEAPVALTHWSFGQLASLIGAPAAYLRQLPAPLAGINLQHGLLAHRAEQMKTLEVEDGRVELRAVTGPDYGRIYDHELVDAVRRIAGNGTGDTRWKVPGVLDWSTGIYNPRIDITKDTTTLYASDRDVFLFLVDDLNPIEAGRLPDGSPDLFFRGFYCWNSEVGAKTLGIASFYLRAVCQNRNLWGVEDFEEITIRHSKYAASRFAHQAAPALERFANSFPVPFVNGIRAARERIVARTDEDRTEFLRRKGFSKAETQKVIETVLAEEGRKPESIFDFVQGITAVARDKPHQDARLDLEARAKKAGGHVSRSGRLTSGKRSHFGRGRTASIQANHLLTGRSRVVVIKIRVVRHTARATPMTAHLSYLRREGVTRDGEKARLFGPGAEEGDGRAFAERCADDRHHFRFIVSPEDAADMADLRSFARDLVGQMEKDLDTKLDWVGVDHWNTDNPHLHILVRGRADDGQDLVISRDYIKEGMRARAQDLVTLELGPRADLDIHRTVERQVEAEGWTQLDRQLVRDQREAGVIDMARNADGGPDAFLPLKVGRLRKLETLGLADEIGPGQWVIDEKAEATLRALGERGDIIKRMHRALTAQGIERGTASYVLAGESLDGAIIGRLVERGLDDELKGMAYAVVDGVDGRTHHIRLPDLDAAGDGAPGSVVELRRFEDGRGQQRVALAVRSDLNIERQVTASGATWLDRQALSRAPASLSEGGFGAEVREAMERRSDHLVREGLAERHGQRVTFDRDLIETLRRREVQALGEKRSTETGQPFNRSGAGDYVAGTYRQRFALASGRFAMIDDGLGFQLVPWTPSLEKQLGKHVSGVARADGGIDWSSGRKRGLGL